jgi:chromosome segregation ATPase
LHLFSPDLKQNLLTAKELVNVLVKKRMALQARKDIFKKELDTFMDKTDAVNKRYEVLRQKLEIEWGKEIAALEEDKLESYKNFKNTEARLDELEHKLMQYRVQDENLNTDRWSLDTKLYYKK